ncbi:hypothetical protein QBC46DRAFT_274422 [Diplogelasinospora grovesii]|uniref:LysM domain-containing protein n=1 Tax=Diplogelasinospora grovesii TaxID=303347 RepID=A0AAN6MX50_9PEZI|nr:hypothetical protein QBC46DRAFT_274422 [Diplogelasinospora grovesii]
MSLFTTLLFCYLIPTSFAAQLFSNASSLPSSASAACASALMSNITCSQLISPLYISNGGYLDVGTLTSLCTSTCSSALSSFQSTAESSCGTAAYSFPGNYSQTVPAIVDPVVWAYNVACLQSGSTYCVPTVTNTSGGIAPCSDCFLKYEAAMLESAYGQTRVTPDDFSSLLSSCSAPATSYPYTTPVPTTATTTTSGTASSASVTTFCTGTPYTVKSGDTCASIAQANSVATDRFVTDNHLDYNCTAILPGSQVCIPQSCLLYEIKTNDTCDSILADEDYSLNQLLSWNPTIHSTCDNLDSMIGREICISPPGTTSWDIVSGNISATWNVTFVLPPTSFTVVPNQTVVPNYTTTYLNPTTPVNITTTTVTVDTAAATSYASLLVYCPITNNDAQNGWTIPDLPDNCTSALSVYCSPSSNATTPPSTVFPTTCSPAYWDSLLSSTAVRTTTNGAPGPTQSGEPSNCDAWYLVQANDTCDAVVSKYGNFTLAQFYSWNPAVGSSCQYLDPGYAVCIGVSSSGSSSSSFISASKTTSSAGPTTTAPSPTLPSTDPQCTSYYYVEPNDSCYNIEQEYDISADEFNAWNPFVGSDCANLWASEYICIGAPYTSSTSSTTTTSATATAPSPLEPSTDPECTQWHYVVSGDTCYALEQTYGITMAQVSALNELSCAYLPGVLRLILRVARRLEPHCRGELRSVAGLLRLRRGTELGSYGFRIRFQVALWQVMCNIPRTGRKHQRPCTTWVYPIRTGC